MILETITRYEEICDQIINLDTHIKYIKIININGRVVSGVVKNKFEFFIGGKDEEVLYMEIALRTKMLGDFDSFLGLMNFSVYNRKNVIIMEFPIENATVYISSEKETDLNKIPFEILAVLRKENVLNLI